jgi:hypothetical protein
MADIKAKDIAVAQSVAANDLILGSSIAGTTANVTVETVGKYIIEQLNLSSLDGTISERIQNLTKLQAVGQDFAGSKTLEWEYTGISLTIPNNHVYLVWGNAGWGETTPKGVALSSSNQYTWFNTVTEITSGILVYYTPPLIRSSGTVYLWEKRAGQGTNRNNIYYIDLGKQQN